MGLSSVSPGSLISRPEFPHSHCRLPVLNLDVHPIQKPVRISRLAARAQGKGFGAGTQTAGRSAKGKKSSVKGIEELKKINGASGEPVVACPCGGGEEKRAYPECCGRYHGGVREPDAVTLMSEWTACRYMKKCCCSRHCVARIMQVNAVTGKAHSTSKHKHTFTAVHAL